MKIVQLYYFLDLAQTLSITKTAQNFYISQQALSDSFKKLEDEFQTELFSRTKHGVLLTQSGLDFIETARAMLALYEKALNKKKPEEATIGNSLKIAVHPRVMNLFFYNALRKFNKQYPDVIINCIEETNDGIFSLIANKGVDIGFVAIVEDIYKNAPILYTDRLGGIVSIDMELLAESGVVLCMTKKLAEKFKNDGTPLTTRMSPLVCYERSMNMLEKYVAEYSMSFHQNSVFTSSDPSVHKRLVTDEMAIEMISQLEYTKCYGRHANIVGLPINMMNYFCAIYNNTQPLSSAAKMLLEYVRNEKKN